MHMQILLRLVGSIVLAIACAFALTWCAKILLPIVALILYTLRGLEFRQETIETYLPAFVGFGAGVDWL